MNLKQRIQAVAGLLKKIPAGDSASPGPQPAAQEPAPPPAEKGFDPLLTALAQQWMIHLEAGAVAAKLRVVWNSRLQTTAGTASLREGRIELNPRLRDMGAEQVERTLRHEAAHLLAHWRAGRRRIQTHGPEWRAACADLEIPGEAACHSLPFPRRRLTPKFFYRCLSCGLALQRVRRLLRRTACLHCCRRHSGGNHDPRFEFIRTDPPLDSAPSMPPAM